MIDAPFPFRHKDYQTEESADIVPKGSMAGIIPAQSSINMKFLNHQVGSIFQEWKYS